MTVSEWVPVLCTNDEGAKREERTYRNDNCIYINITEDMLSRERTMDCIIHRLLGENTIY